MSGTKAVVLGFAMFFLGIGFHDLYPTDLIYPVIAGSALIVMGLGFCARDENE